MNDNLKEKLIRFAAAHFITQDRQFDGNAWVVFTAKSRAEQRTQITDWLTAQKAINTAQKNNLEAEKVAREAAYNTENAKIDSAISDVASI